MANENAESSGSLQTVRVLRIGILQGGKIIHERLIKPGQSVTIGESEKNTFVFKAHNLPKRHMLFKAKGDQVSLCFTDSMSGMIALPGGIISLKEARASGAADLQGDSYVVQMNKRSRGKVVIGDTTVLFQYVAAPPESARLVARQNFRPELLEEDDPVFLGFLALWGALGSVLLIVALNAKVVDIATPEDVENLVAQGEAAKELLDEPDPTEGEGESEEEGDGPAVEEATEETVEESTEQPTEAPTPTNTPTEATAPTNTAPMTDYQQAVNHQQQTAAAQDYMASLGLNNGGGSGDVQIGSAGGPSNGGSGPVSGPGAIHGPPGPGGPGPGIGPTGPIGPSGPTGPVTTADAGPTTNATVEGPTGIDTTSTKRADIKPGGSTLPPMDADDKTKIDRGLGVYQKQIQNCYRIALNKGDTSGTLTLTFNIDANGKAGNIRTSTSGTLDSGFTSCVKTNVARWSFRGLKKDHRNIQIKYVLEGV